MTSPATPFQQLLARLLQLTSNAFDLADRGWGRATCYHSQPPLCVRKLRCRLASLPTRHNRHHRPADSQAWAGPHLSRLRSADVFSPQRGLHLGQAVSANLHSFNNLLSGNKCIKGEGTQESSTGPNSVALEPPTLPAGP